MTCDNLDVEDFIQKGEFHYPIVVPQKYCPQTLQRLYALPGGRFATKSWILEHGPGSINDFKTLPKIKH